MNYLRREDEHYIWIRIAMSYMLSDIAVLFDDSEDGQRVLNFAVDLAAEYGARVVGICMEPISRYQLGSGSAQDESIEHIIQSHAVSAARRVLCASEFLSRAASRRGVDTEFRVASTTDSGRDLALHSLCCDLVVVGDVSESRRSEAWTSIRSVRQAGVPLLVVPRAWNGDQIGRRAVVAWNGSRHARRAVSDALPLLIGAHWVDLLIVDPERAPGRHVDEPGADIAAYLARHGVEVEVVHIACGARPVAAALLSHAKEVGADLFVFGAYGRAQSSGSAEGGVTRTLLAEPVLPLFVSH